MRIVKRNWLRPSRRSLYFTGMSLCGIGLILIVWVLASVAGTPGGFANLAAQARSIGVRVVCGVALISIGFAVMTLTDSVLADGTDIDELFSDDSNNDPPWLAQGTEDARFEADRPQETASPSPSRKEPPAGLCCLGCKTLNRASARYCDQCARLLRTDSSQAGGGRSSSAPLTQSA